MDYQQGADSWLLRALGSRMAVAGRDTRSEGSRNGSKFRALALLVRLSRLIEEPVKLTGRGVALDLAVPILPISL